MSSHHEVPAPIVVECDLDEPPEKVWRALTEKKLLEAWLAADPAPSQPASPASPAAPARSRPRAPAFEWEVSGGEPYRWLCFRWRDGSPGSESGAGVIESTVRFELSPHGSGGTHLRLIHGDFRVVSLSTQTFGSRSAHRIARRPTAAAHRFPYTSALKLAA